MITSNVFRGKARLTVQDAKQNTSAGMLIVKRILLRRGGLITFMAMIFF
jgi:hypothetical protein